VLQPSPKSSWCALCRLARRAVGAAAAGTAVLVVFAPPAAADGLIPLPSLKLPVRHAGYQLATETGDVLPFGAASSGAPPAAGVARPVVGVARTLTGAGAWTATADGGVLTSGDAPFYGSMGATPLRSPVVGITASPTGDGYWLVAADGGVFTFGDARFHGSPSTQALRAPAVGIVATRRGTGYWVVAADGGVFTFGDARFHGSLQGPMQAPVTSMAATRSGAGYWLAAADGGVFTFGDARFHGAAVGRTHSPVVGVAASRTGAGYWLAAADGGVFSYGDAPFLGSAPGRAKVVGIAAGVGRLRSEPVAAKSVEVRPGAVVAEVVAPELQNRFGHDISWPQCDGPYPAPGYGHGIVGVTGGRPFTRNRCLASQWEWARSHGSGASVYVNIASPYYGEAASLHGPAGDCAPSDLPCQTYNFSANTVTEALAHARASGVDAPMWWLDVEVANHWTANDALNTLSVRAAAETLEKAGIRAGVYSTALMWRRITGGAHLALPVWVAGAPTDADAPSWCGRPEKDFTGGGIWLVQSLPGTYDVNYLCPPALPFLASAFRFGD
jgi:hypothetical protein